jgi:hypothetical protein
LDRTLRLTRLLASVDRTLRVTRLLASVGSVSLFLRLLLLEVMRLLASQLEVRDLLVIPRLKIISIPVCIICHDMH